MPRRRRHPKRRPPLPQGLQQISLAERCQWSADGPLLDTDLEGRHVPDGYHAWPNWNTWAEFCAQVREQLLRDRPWLRDTSAAETLYAAWRAGDDVDVVRAQMRALDAAHDPRLIVEARHAA